MPRRYHPDGPGVPTSFRLVPAVVVKIREAAKERQLPVAQIVTEAVEHAYQSVTVFDAYRA